MIADDSTTRPFDLIGERYEQWFTDRAAQISEVDWLIGMLPAGARVLDADVALVRPSHANSPRQAWTLLGT
jgi:hypothetical protein